MGKLVDKNETRDDAKFESYPELMRRGFQSTRYASLRTIIITEWEIL